MSKISRIPNNGKSQIIFAMNFYWAASKSPMTQESRNVGLHQCISLYLRYIHGSPFVEK